MARVSFILPKNEVKNAPKVDLPSPTHYAGKWERSTRQWTFTTVWDSTISELVSNSVSDEGGFPFTKFGLIDMVNSRAKKLTASFRPVCDECFVVRIKEIQFPPVSNNILQSNGSSYIYSQFSDMIEMNNIQFLFFRGEGHRDVDKRACSGKSITAYSGLAQILAVKVEVDDIFIISGSGFSLSGNKTAINLSGNRDYPDDSLDIVHLPNYVHRILPKVNMLERICPHPDDQNMFKFTYAACTKEDRCKPFYKEITVQREFHFCEEKEDEDKSDEENSEPFKMPITRNHAEAITVYKAMGCSTLGVLNYENKYLVSDVNNNASLYVDECVSVSDVRNSKCLVFLQLLLAFGVFLAVYLAYKVNPYFLESLGTTLELEDEWNIDQDIR